MTAADPYQTLGVSRDAGADEIKSAYRKAARKYHPDVNHNDPTAEENFKKVGEAYAILSDPERKARFDQYGVTDEQPQDPFYQGGGAGNFGDIFDMFFGGQGGPQQQRRPRSGRDGEDVRVDVEITLEDVLTGTEKTAKYRRSVKCDECSGTGSEGGKPRETCPTCQGSGQVSRVQQTFIGQIRTSTPCPTCSGEGTVVETPCKKCRGRGTVAGEREGTIKIPAGIDDGATIRYGGQGGEGTGEGSNGDLYAVVSIKDHERFDRDGMQLYTAAKVSFVQATLGTERTIEGLAEEIKLKIPAGTQPEHVITFRGHGLPRLHGGPRGDLHIRIDVLIPKKVTEAQEKLLREYAELAGENVTTHEGGFLEGLFKWKK